MAKLALSLLGRPLFVRDGVPIEITGRKTVALLTYLAVTGEHHHRDKLAALFWPRFPKVRARAALRKTLMEARHALGQEWVETEGELVGLSFKDDLWLDVRQVNALLDRLEEEHGSSDRDELARLKQVVDLYRSDFLSGFNLDSNSTFGEWQHFQAEGLRKRIISILDRLVEAHVGSGEHGVAIAYARRRLGIDPADEAAHRRLMRIYAATGQYALAIRQYRDCCRRLEREIGVKPDEVTEQLYRDVVARRPVAPADPHEARESRQTPRAGPAGPRPSSMGRLRAILVSRVAVVVVCTAVFFAAGGGILAIVSATAAARPRTITVFPLAVRSADAAPESFALGVADALVTQLAGLPRLEVRVVGRIAADQRESAASQSAAAVAMGVSFYVEGSLFRVKDKVHISLTLVEARHGVVMWAKGYDPSLLDPLAEQSEIAADACAGIARKLGLE